MYKGLIPEMRIWSIYEEFNPILNVVSNLAEVSCLYRLQLKCIVLNHTDLLICVNT